jgi:hypothetical protein
MKIIACEQNSPEWYAARAGIPTASSFDKIITATGKPSAQAENYALRLLAEIMTGGPIQEFDGNGWTERGHELEQEAADYYAALNDDDPLSVGFVTNDAGTIGCSPDRLIGLDGLLEIKCPSAHAHMSYLLDPEALKKAYFVQTQGQLFVTGRKWCDLISYFPALPVPIVRVTPDLSFQTALAASLSDFLDRIECKKAKLQALGYMKEAA